MINIYDNNGYVYTLSQHGDAVSCVKLTNAAGYGYDRYTIKPLSFGRNFITLAQSGSAHELLDSFGAIMWNKKANLKDETHTSDGGRGVTATKTRWGRARRCGYRCDLLSIYGKSSESHVPALSVLRRRAT